MEIKLCGIKRLEDIGYLNECLPDYAGFIFASSKRQVSKEQAKFLVSQLNESIKPVGVFVNEDISVIVDLVKVVGLDIVQLHGDEDNQYITNLKKLLPNIIIWKAIRLKNQETLHEANKFKVDKLLIDSFSKDEYGGSGKIANWDMVIKHQPNKPFFLAGGIDINNIEEAVLKVKPDGIDISSSIETNGVKDKHKIKAIMSVYRRLK